MTVDQERLDKLVMEMRRGMLILAVLQALNEPHYGYSLRKLLAAIGLEIDEGTLYPLLRRLEDQDLLSSTWQAEGGRKRRVYLISEGGQIALQRMTDEWQKLGRILGQLAEK